MSEPTPTPPWMREWLLNPMEQIDLEPFRRMGEEMARRREERMLDVLLNATKEMQSMPRPAPTSDQTE